MENYDIAFALKRLDNRIRRKMDERTRVKELGITPEQLFVIRYLNDREDRDVFQRDFESEFRLSRATVSSTLSLMEKKGLIRRESVPNDARLKKLTLAPQAKALNAIARETVSEINRALSDALAPDQRVLLRSLLEKLESALDGVNDSAFSTVSPHKNASEDEHD